MTLRLVIENTPENEMVPMPSNDSSDFVQAALRSAANSNDETREAILIDICDVLGCTPVDLKFLFTQKTVPDRSSRQYELELPDYRMNRSDIFKDVAE